MKFLRGVAGLCFLLALSSFANAISGDWALEPDKELDHAALYSVLLGVGLLVVSFGAWMFGNRFHEQELLREYQQQYEEEPRDAFVKPEASLGVASVYARDVESPPLDPPSEAAEVSADLPKWFSPDNPPGTYLNPSTGKPGYWTGDRWMPESLD